MTTHTFQLNFNKTTGRFSLSSTAGPLLSSDFKVIVPAGTTDAEIEFLAPTGFNIVQVQTTILVGSDSPAIIIVGPTLQKALPLFSFNVGTETEISFSLEKLTAESVKFMNTNGPKATTDVKFGVWLRLEDTNSGIIYQTRDPQIDDVREGGG